MSTTIESSVLIGTRPTTTTITPLNAILDRFCEIMLAENASDKTYTNRLEFQYIKPMIRFWITENTHGDNHVTDYEIYQYLTARYGKMNETAACWSGVRVKTIIELMRDRI